MKTTDILFLILVSFFMPVFISCEEVSYFLPNELLGTWTGNSDIKGYSKSYTFKPTSYTFSGTTSDGSTDSYTENIAEVWLDEKIFRTPDNSYFVWNIDGNRLYLDKTDSHSSKPSPVSNWWVNFEPYYKE